MIKCPFCNSDSERVHVGTRDNKDIDIYSCKQCETKFLSNLDSNIAYDDGEMYENSILNKLIEDSGLYEILEAKQIQRYTLANHLMWLANEKPEGVKYGIL